MSSRRQIDPRWPALPLLVAVAVTFGCGQSAPDATVDSPLDTPASVEETSEPMEEPMTAKEKGLAFLAENGKRTNVVTTASGLQYEVMASGNGKTPKATDTVTTHYHGTFIDGRVFDSSVQRNQPAEFPVNGVIRGWTEALQLMQVGDKWKLYVPSDLAYGSRGVGDIGPDETLIFEVELLGVRSS